MHLLKHYSFPLEIITAAYFWVSVPVSSLGFHKKRNLNSNHLNMLTIDELFRFHFALRHGIESAVGFYLTDVENGD